MHRSTGRIACDQLEGPSVIPIRDQRGVRHDGERADGQRHEHDGDEESGHQLFAGATRTRLAAAIVFSSATLSKIGFMRLIDLSGQRFFRLLVTSRAGRRSGSTAWNCRCDCGRDVVVLGENLKSGNSRSCGCLHDELYAARVEAHGATIAGKKTPEHIIWSHIKTRCLNQKAREYPNYGGRGITICDRWRNSFEHFLSDMGRRPSADHEIDRIDNDGHYEPDNCRWATRDEQNNNKRNNRHVLVGGVSLTLAQAAERHDVGYAALWRRVVLCNEPAEAAISDLHRLGSRFKAWQPELRRRA